MKNLLGLFLQAMIIAYATELTKDIYNGKKKPLKTIAVVFKWLLSLCRRK
ncbi:hypothetical protein [Bacillus cereus group sp. BfR-BA-01422]|nr:hypothetical protein [Bacillus cereus group sp. BfR-BA-01422]